VTGVLFLSILAPVGLSLWLAHRQVETKFIDELDMFSTRVALRTERVGEQARKALRHIESFQGVPCSDEHLLEMRRLSYSYRYIQEVLYLKDNVPQCSSLEKNSQAAAFPPAMKVTPDGYRAWLTTQNDLGIKRFMAALGSEHYVVMVDPGSFIDVIPFGSWPIEVTIIGTARNVVVASSAALPSDVLQHVKQEHSITHFQKDSNIFNARPFPELGITIVTWASTLPLQKTWHRQALIWLPAGIIIGLLTAAFILRILRRLQSPHHQLQDAIQHRSITNPLSRSQREKWSGQKHWPVGSRPMGAICRLKFLSRWRRRPD